MIEIDERGFIVEKLSFNHSAPSNQVQHLYFNNRLDKMIELLLTKGSGSKSTVAVYNEFILDATKTWVFIRTLNQSEN